MTSTCTLPAKNQYIVCPLTDLLPQQWGVLQRRALVVDDEGGVWLRPHEEAIVKDGEHWMPDGDLLVRRTPAGFQVWLEARYAYRSGSVPDDALPVVRLLLVDQDGIVLETVSASP